jgi:hypothetical protein
MSIFESLFGAKPTPQQQGVPTGQGVQPNPNAPTGVNNPGQAIPGGTPGNGVVPAGTQNNGGAPGNSDAEPASPLAAFTDIWQSPTTPNSNDSGPMFANLDPAKLMESARKVNFAGALTQENLQKIQAGGAEAIQALQESLNSVAQTVYAQSALATTKIVEQALGKQQERYDANLPSLVKKFSVGENLSAANPILSNPAIQPLVEALKSQLIQKNPNATGAEIQTQVTDYFAALGNVFAPKPAAAKNAKVSKSEDWDTFFQ